MFINKKNKKLNKKLRLVMILFLFCGSLTAMEWPLPNAAVTQNFGSNEKGRPVLGTVFEGEGELRAAGDGEIFFSRNEKDTASRLPSPFGAWTAVDHGDGLISIYGRYRDDGKTLRPPEIKLGDPVAQAGISGWSRREGFYFTLYDRKERRWVNASMVIPPFPDTQPPQISGIQLRAGNGRVFEGAQLRNLSQGSYTVIINAFDTLTDTRGTRLAPYRIVCSVNGVEVGILSFETIYARNGTLMVNRNRQVPARQVYESFPAFEAGEVYLSRGQVLLEILVHDVAGNVQSSVTYITVE